MIRLSDARLVVMALRSLEDVLVECDMRAVPRCLKLRVILAYLFSRSRSPERWPFDRFWQAIANEQPNDRVANANACSNAIYSAVGEKRSQDRVEESERKAWRERHRLAAMDRATRQAATNDDNDRV